MQEENTIKALAMFAHPDDIEFSCAGTLAMLRRRGVETHYLTLANGCCGSMVEDREQTARRRWSENQSAAKVLEAVAHPPLFDDLEILFGRESARLVSAVVRRIRPNIILTHAVEDYMEDHMETARLALHAAFTASMPNYITEPSVPPVAGSCALYHALPHGLRSPRDGTRAYPSFYVDISETLPLKREALACHESQKLWLDQTQGMDAYLEEMERMALEQGSDTGCFKFAEGFTRHSSLGLSSESFHPLEEVLAGSLWLNNNYPQAPRGS